MSYGFNPHPKKYSQPKLKTGIKQKIKEPTGELKVFKEIYVERVGKCQVTGEKILFHPISFMHILSKGSNPRLRLRKENIYMVIPEIHDLYDNGSREHLISIYPKAKKIYELKEKLKIEANKPEPSI